jgi:hypothetical protein
MWKVEKTPFFFERKCGRGSPYGDFGFLKIRTQICICGDLNLGDWVVHPLPWEKTPLQQQFISFVLCHGIKS